MTREYKFRGKRKDNGQWVEGALLRSGGQTWIIDPYEADISSLHGVTMPDGEPMVVYDVDPATVGEFTGLTDENGKDLEWWEGDTFKMFLRGTFIIQRMESGGFYFVDPEGIATSILCLEASKWATLPEKIGTIHDAPEDET